MRLSPDKINKLSHLVIDKIAAHPEIRFFDTKNNARLAVLKVITDELRLDDSIDIFVKKKLEQRSAKLPTGSEEWELAYHKLYEEELNKKGRL